MRGLTEFLGHHKKNLYAHYLCQEMEAAYSSADWACIEHNICYSSTPTMLQLLVPRRCVPEVLRLCHTGTVGGHFGVKRTMVQVQHRLLSAVTWTNPDHWRQDVHVLEDPQPEVWNAFLFQTIICKQTTTSKTDHQSSRGQQS